MNEAQNNSTLEMSAAGALCCDEKLIDQLARILVPEDFQNQYCREIFLAALDAKRNRTPFDPVVAVHALSGKMGDERARRFVRACLDETPTTANADYRARVLHETASASRLRAALLDKLMGAPYGSGNDMAADVMQQCREFLEREQSGRTTTLQKALVDVYQALSNNEKPARVDTGFQKLDAYLKGIWAGNLCVIGARPGVGKSAMGLTIAENVAKNGGTVLIYSMEMLAGELAERMIVRKSNAALNDLIDGNLTQQQFRDIADACNAQSRLPILINDSANMTVSKIRGEAASVDGLRLIIVDFISLMHGERKYDSRNLELGAISRDLKNLAADLKVPVIALAQLNRGKTDTSQPSMIELRDSGELEQNANKILLMWYTDKENRKIGVRVDKNRRGIEGNIEFRFDGAHMRFYEMDYIHDEPGGNGRHERRTDNGLWN